MRASDLDYALPEALIATAPAEPRESARLMVVPLEGGPPQHVTIADLPRLLEPPDTLIVNETRVVPALLAGVRAADGRTVDGLWLAAPAPGAWRIILHGSRRFHPGDVLRLGPADASVEIVLRARDGEAWLAEAPRDADAAALLAQCGRTPLPPYIRRARRARAQIVDDAVDRAWYQTVFARSGGEGGSVAAPTAGLHLTPAVLRALEARGIGCERIRLDVGPGTFRPIETGSLDEHPMHEERFEVPPRVVARLRAREAGAPGRIIAVGTTVVRTLESLPAPLPPPPEDADPGGSGGGTIRGATRLFIRPPWTPRFTEGLLTNFHLPRSTLLALVAAFIGLERLLDLYRVAVAERYRFYSYGDAMLILPCPGGAPVSAGSAVRRSAGT